MLELACGPFLACEWTSVGKAQRTLQRCGAVCSGCREIKPISFFRRVISGGERQQANSHSKVASAEE